MQRVKAPTSSEARGLLQPLHIPMNREGLPVTAPLPEDLSSLGSLKDTCANAGKVIESLVHPSIAGVQVALEVSVPGVGSAISGAFSLLGTALNGGRQARLQKRQEEATGLLRLECGQNEHQILETSGFNVECNSGATSGARENERKLWAILEESLRKRREGRAQFSKDTGIKGVTSLLAGVALISVSIITVVPVCVAAGVAAGVAVAKSSVTSGGYLRNSDERRTGWQKVKNFSKVFSSFGNRRKKEVALHQALIRKLKITDISTDDNKGFHPKVIEFDAQNNNEEICQRIVGLKKADRERRLNDNGKDMQLSSLDVNYQELPDAKGSNLFAVNDSQQKELNARSQCAWSSVEKILSLASVYQGAFSDIGTKEFNKQINDDFTSYYDKTSNVIKVKLKSTSVKGTILTSLGMERAEYYKFRVGLRIVEKMHEIESSLADTLNKCDEVVNTSDQKEANKKLQATEQEAYECYSKMCAVLKRKGGVCNAAKSVSSKVNSIASRASASLRGKEKPKPSCPEAENKEQKRIGRRVM